MVLLEGQNTQFRMSQKHSLFKMAQGMLSPVENDNYRLEEIEELNNAWAVYDKN